MKEEYDFSEGVRGKFYRSDAKLNLPIYLEPAVAIFVQKLANEKRIDQSKVVNALLKRDKELIDYLG